MNNDINKQCILHYIDMIFVHYCIIKMITFKTSNRKRKLIGDTVSSNDSDDQSESIEILRAVEHGQLKPVNVEKSQLLVIPLAIEESKKPNSKIRSNMTEKLFLSHFVIYYIVLKYFKTADQMS